MTPIVNIAGYKFVALDGLHDRRRQLREQCDALGLKGTILISHEGINLFLAGERHSIDQFLNFLRSDEPFADFTV